MEDATTTLDYDLECTRLGTLLVAASPRGVRLVRFGDRRADLVAALRSELPEARRQRSSAALAAYCDAIAAAADGLPSPRAVPLDVGGSRFERRVWRAVAAIPRGEIRAYSDVARALGCPRSARAVARACARNPTPVVVPCHRVVAKNGALGGYAFGRRRKLQLLLAEGAIAADRPAGVVQWAAPARERTSARSPTASLPPATTWR